MRLFDVLGWVVVGELRNKRVLEWKRWKGLCWFVLCCVVLESISARIKQGIVFQSISFF